VEYDEACDGILPWYLLSFTIAACTVPYRYVIRVFTHYPFEQRLNVF